MFREVLNYIRPYDAGIFPEDLYKKYGISEKNVVNLGSNENPYPPPKSVIKEIVKESSCVNRYPDPSYPELKQKLSEYTGLPIENIAVGSGANEILDSICKITLNPFDKVVIPIPSYSIYILLSMLRDASIEYIETEDQNFEVRAEQVINFGKDVKLIFLNSPNNPTGKSIPREEIIKIIEETSALVVVDEAYYEFSRKTIAEKVNEYNNLVVVRSMSKFFSLAGLRIGYALSNPKITEMIEKVRLAFTISNIAEKAAIKALEKQNWYLKIREKIIAERDFVMREISRTKGFTVIPSDANFLLIKLLAKVNMSAIMEELNKKGIIVRDVTGVPGLKNNYIRITMGKKQENRAVISALRELSLKW